MKFFHAKHERSLLFEKNLYKNMDCRYFSLDNRIYCNISIKGSCVFAAKGIQHLCIFRKKFYGHIHNICLAICCIVVVIVAHRQT